MRPVVSLISSGDESADKEHIHPRATLVSALGKVSRGETGIVLCTELAAFFAMRDALARTIANRQVLRGRRPDHAGRSADVLRSVTAHRERTRKRCRPSSASSAPTSASFTSGPTASACSSSRTAARRVCARRTASPSMRITPFVLRRTSRPDRLFQNVVQRTAAYCSRSAAPRPRAGAGGSVPPSARIFMFSSAAVNWVTRRARSASRAASSASIELSNIRV